MEEFAERREVLFESLDNASKELKGIYLDQSNRNKYTVSALKRTRSCDSVMMYRSNGNILANANDKSLTHMRGKESIFKKPELPIGKCLRPSKTPDYEIHPHRWKKYILEEMDISENSNTAAAVAYLSEMDERNSNEVHGAVFANNEHLKIQFKSLSKIKRNIKEIESANLPDGVLDKAKFKGPKFVMPEYVVGQSQANKKKKQINKSNNHAAKFNLKLAHLVDYDDEEM